MAEERALDRGKPKGAATDLPVSYVMVLDSLKSQLRAARLRAHRVVNNELLSVYWTIGRAILDQQTAERRLRRPLIIAATTLFLPRGPRE